MFTVIEALQTQASVLCTHRIADARIVRSGHIIVCQQQVVRESHATTSTSRETGMVC